MFKSALFFVAVTLITFLPALQTDAAPRLAIGKNASPTTSHVRPARFYSEDSSPISNDVQSAAGAKEATVSVKTQTGTCTGTYVSSNGHLLTALHCLQRDLLANKLVLVETIDAEAGQFIISVDRAKAIGSLLSVYINGAQYPAIIAAIGGGIITGSGRLTLADGQSQRHQELIDKNIGPHGDFAVLQVFTFQTTKCARVAQKMPVANEPVWNLGFPGKTERGDGFDSNGVDRFVSTGRVYGRASNNKCLKDIFADASPEAWAFLDQFYSLQGTQLTDLDGSFGSSGGGVFNSQGELVGVVSEVIGMESPEKAHCGAMTTLLVDQIKGQIEADRTTSNNSAAPSRIFDCR